MESKPDLGDCESKELKKLKSTARLGEKDPVPVVMSKLVHLTSPKSVTAEEKGLFGGDLDSAVSVMKSSADRLQYQLQSQESIYNRQSHVQNIFQNVLRSADHLLSEGNSVAWADLKRGSKMKIAGKLMKVLEAHAFIMAQVLPEEERMEEKTKEIGK